MSHKININSYNNLTIKSIYILKYFNSLFDENEGSNKFLLKTDDDSYVHLEALWGLAKSRILKNSNDLIGFLELGSKKNRFSPYAHKPTKKNFQNKRLLRWLIPNYMYPKSFFPQYLSGSGYFITRKGMSALRAYSYGILVDQIFDPLRPIVMLHQNDRYDSQKSL